MSDDNPNNLASIRIAHMKYPLECHHIVRYGGNQSLFINHVLSMDDKHNELNESNTNTAFFCSLCLDCAYKLFIRSRGFKLFEGLCVNPNPLLCLHIVSQIISHPQIIHFISSSRNTQAFISFFKLTVATMNKLAPLYNESELNISGWMRGSIKKNQYYTWRTILTLILPLNCRSFHLKSIMSLRQPKDFDRCGYNYWECFIMKPFHLFLEQARRNEKNDPLH